MSSTNTSSHPMVLFIGIHGSGKTTIMKRLNEDSNQGTSSADFFNAFPSSVPTVGTNVIRWKPSELSNSSSKVQSIVLKEVGGEMREIWPQHYHDANVIVYVIDSSDLSESSHAAVELLRLISSLKEKNQFKPIIIVLNKIENEALNLRYALFLDDIMNIGNESENQSNQPSLRVIKPLLIECSCRTGKGIGDLRQSILTSITKTQ